MPNKKQGKVVNLCGFRGRLNAFALKSRIQNSKTNSQTPRPVLLSSSVNLCSEFFTFGRTKYCWMRKFLGRWQDGKSLSSYKITIAYSAQSSRVTHIFREKTIYSIIFPSVVCHHQEGSWSDFRIPPHLFAYCLFKFYKDKRQPKIASILIRQSTEIRCEFWFCLCTSWCRLTAWSVFRSRILFFNLLSFTLSYLHCIKFCVHLV